MPFRRLFPTFGVTLLVVFLPAVHGPGFADEKASKPGDFVITQKGTLPIIVSAPHGGRKKVPDVPERLGIGVDKFATVRDDNTAELAEKFVAALEKKLDGKPWVVLARFERKYLDVNRPRDGAYESEKAKPYYDAYHDPLTAACKAVQKEFGRGLLLDIHGQGQFPDSICRGTQNGKTVKLLKDRFGWPAVTGKRSVLGQMELAGYKVVPPCDAGEVVKEDARFNGGFIVSNYGSHTGYAIDAIQFEFGTYLRDRDAYPKTARDLADAVAIFHDEYLKK
jgi:N-formylglutamate amidohydrolase